MPAKLKKSITIMVPALNEEDNIEKAVDKYIKAAKGVVDDFEILIFDDGSTDKTGRIADKLAKKNKKVRVVHNKKNMGLGYNFRTGARLAKMNYYTFFSGEGEIYFSSARNILKNTGKADLIASYYGNPKVRPWYRRIISWGFTTLLNILFGLKIKNYTGAVTYPTKTLRNIKMTTDSFAFQAEGLVRMLKKHKNYTYIQLPYKRAKTEGSTLFRVKNMIGVLKTITLLFYDIYLK